MLWELLTGRRLFAGDSDISVIEKVRSAQIPPPHHFNPAVSPELSRAVMHALAPHPDARPGTAGQWRTELLTAEPSARSVDPSVVAQLVRELMKEHIAKQRERLGSRSGVVSNTEASRPERESTEEHQLQVERAFAQLTVSKVDYTEATRRAIPGAAQVTANNSGRRLRWAAVAGGVALVGLLAGFYASNLLFGHGSPEQTTQEAAATPSAPEKATPDAPP